MELEAMISEGRPGLDNLQLMVPFAEPRRGGMVAELLNEKESGLNQEPTFVMVELPSNVIEADRFIEMMGLAGGSIDRTT